MFSVVVNGGWSGWSNWTSCPETCGDEVLSRDRTCTNPAPENNGTFCDGDASETMSCYSAGCPGNICVNIWHSLKIK